MRKGEATRREIIQKAAPIFNQKGFEGASLSDLMRATGLEKGGIYRHFESKEQLAAEAFDYAWDAAMALRLAGTEEIGNSVDRLKQIVRNFRARREGLVAGGCPLLNTAIDSDDGNVLLRGKAKRALNGLLNRLETIATVGQERNEIKRDVDAKDLATLIVSMLEGSLMLRRLQKDEAPLALACRTLETYLEEKVRATPRSVDPRNACL
jgi:TetR/AcrR family transcriptional regulator, transcriptional repressor for nem operon